jgi:enoyl-CoA hydratase/carnithine racemase
MSKLPRQPRAPARGPRAAGFAEDVRGGAAWWTIDCRASAGVLTAGAAQALCAAAERVRLDAEVRVVVLRARGRDFCLGWSPGDWASHVDCVRAVADLPQPVIAAVGGPAAAEGCELLLAADVRLAGTGARLAFTHVAAGSLPRYGATQRLPRLVGRSRALELLWSGRAVSAAEALRIGLVSRVVPPARLAAETAALVEVLRRRGPIALRLAKEAVRAAGEVTLAQGMRIEEDLYVLLQTTRDRAEGIRAFRARRPPRFRGV